MKFRALLIVAAAVSFAGAANAQGQTINYADRAQKSCIAQYRGANPNGGTAAAQQAYVNACVRAADIQQPQFAQREQASCIAQYRSAKAKGATTQSQAVYVNACMKR